jgi:serine/threonine-protein kinase
VLEIDEVAHAGSMVAAGARRYFFAGGVDGTTVAPAVHRWGTVATMSEWHIAGWQVLGRIARGSTADVLLAQPDLSGEVTPASLSLGLSGPLTAEGGQRVILKRLYPHLAANEDFVRMFVDEIRLMSLLQHEGIVDVKDLDEDDETFYAVLELVDGPSLSAALRLHQRQRDHVDAGVACAIAARVAAALDVVHHATAPVDGGPQSGAPLALVHRDVNPQNILLGRDDAVKLSDFGVARSAAARKNGILAARDTNAGVLKGKVSFLSPEQVQGKDVDARADLFALGATLYRMLTGHVPFAGDSDVALLDAIVHTTPPPPSASQPSLPSSLDALTLSVLEKDPARRPQRARDVAVALGEFQGASGVVGDFVKGLGLPSLRS